MILRKCFSILYLVFGFICGFYFHKTYESSVFYKQDIKSHLIDNDLLKEKNIIERKPNATKLYNDIKVLCWILTSPATHESKAKHVKATWGKRCNKILFMSTKLDDSLPSIDLGVKEGRDYLWGKTRAAFKIIYDKYIDDYDWFLKADDDSYIILENLRYMLSNYDPETPIHFGAKFKAYFKKGWMSGGSGYVLSRSAVKKFVKVALPNPNICRESPNTFAEDLEIGICLGNIGVMVGDSRDEKGKSRFMPFPPITHLTPGRIGSDNWFWDYVYYPTENNPNCCSGNAIGFHYITPEQMYELEYLIYNVFPYGIEVPNVYPPLLPPDDDSIPSNVLKAKLTSKNNT